MKIVFTVLLFCFHLYAAGQDFSIKYQKIGTQSQILDMAYRYEKAASTNGKTVLLLHGKNFSGEYWMPVMQELLAKGYDVIAPDQIGFGRSSKPMQYQYSFQQLSFNTKKLLDTLGIKKVTVLGHSMGGMLAIRFAIMFPVYCSQLVLEDPIGLEDWKLVAPYSTIDTEYAKEKKKTAASVKQYFLENYFHNEWNPAYDDLLQQSTSMLADTTYAWSMALTTDMIFTQPVSYEFKNITVPVILMIGTLDRTAIGKERVAANVAATMGNYPALGKKAAALMPSCKLIQLNGIGHIPHIEHFDLFIKTLFAELK